MDVVAPLGDGDVRGWQVLDPLPLGRGTPERGRRAVRGQGRWRGDTVSGYGCSIPLFPLQPS